MRNRYYGQRHGESLANAQGIIISLPAAGCAGYGLTDRGREQARACALGCVDLGPATIIYSSDFRRARETAEVARAALGAGPVHLTPALRERAFGELEGGPNTAYGPTWARDRQDPDHRDRGVEPARAVQARAWALVQELERTHEGATVLLVAHGDPLQLVATAFQGRDAGEHRDVPHWEPGEVRRLDVPERSRPASRL